ncbi:hypothetical protein [Allonocardiopsis opalescens]|uniref:Polyketide cyclase/dehydrase/lipid transport protein n=1 Tax=Allonocardiopsis opalescens TaxID=1144618 RepID=A0A2T0PW77_9ACTN|nr:hypothetical protein [Allonocardiopsis opalescens]PRX95680.1 hypothetical protein CLV72_109291 [Allonocardiopsis opalescens]
MRTSERFPWNWGATASELAAEYACDRYLPGGGTAAMRAVDVDAPADIAFRWLCQLKVAPYSYDLLDNWGRRSPRTLTPGAERLAAGDTVMTIFRLAEFEPDRELALVPLPTGERLFGPMAVGYRAVPAGEGGSRLIGRLCLPPGPRTYLLACGDLLMMRKQLLTLAACAARTYREARPA